MMSLPRCPLVIAVMLGLILAAGCRPAPVSGAQELPAVRVKVAPVAVHEFIERVRIQGTLQARGTAKIAARIPGPIDEMFVDEGDRVSAGQNLFQTDKLKLESQVEIEQRNLDVAAAAVAEAEAGLRQSQAALDKATLDFQRFKQLFTEHQAVTQDAVEKAESGFKQATAAVDYNQAVINLAKARQLQAGSALKIAVKRLADSLVAAPFAGVITLRMSKAGEFANDGAPVLLLEDRQTLELSLAMDSEYYPRVLTGETPAVVTVGGMKLVEGPITYKSLTVDPITRTFEIRIKVPEQSGITSGMIGNVDLLLTRRQAPGIPLTAVSRRRDTSCIFVAAGNQAKLLPVKTGLDDGLYAELLEPANPGSLQVVVEGQAFLNDRTPIVIIP